MQGKIVHVEDYVSNQPVRVLVLKPTLSGEAAAFKRLRDSGVRTLRAVFTENRELRIVLPDSTGVVPNVIYTEKGGEL